MKRKLHIGCGTYKLDGWINTDLEPLSKDITKLDATSPFGRVSVPEDVAAAVVWLVSDANPYANGQKINIDGGN